MFLKGVQIPLHNSLVSSDENATNGSRLSIQIIMLCMNK